MNVPGVAGSQGTKYDEDLARRVGWEVATPVIS